MQLQACYFFLPLLKSVAAIVDISFSLQTSSYLLQHRVVLLQHGKQLVHLVGRELLLDRGKTRTLRNI